jgi:ATP-dependent Clp protease adaptor protein ClpS
MSSSSQSAVVDVPDANVEERTKSREKNKQEPQRPYAVILHNDDLNTVEFVVGVLRKVFHYEHRKAFKLMLEAHRTGRSIVWTGMLEVAELKADQIRSCGADPLMSARGALPLRVTIERLP